MGDHRHTSQQTPTKWCSYCQIPTTEAICLACGRTTEYLVSGRKLRPVYREEIELMSRLVGVPLMAQPADLVLWRSGREYYALGRKVFRLSGGSVTEPPRLSVHDRELMGLLRGERRGRRPAAVRRSSEETAGLFREANSLHLTLLVEEAIRFLRDTRGQYSDLPLVVSWSGGKDSTVASALTQEAFPDERIIHIFADTTIELPGTYEYLRDFRKANPATPFLVGLPERGFFDLCREIGPPSRIQRWCCTTHKAAPLADVLRAVGGGGQVLVVGGLRRSESQRRQSYPRIIADGKIGQQVLLSPLADWTDYDVWAWLIAAGGGFSSAYRLGLDRVGCAFCPNARDWSDMLGVTAYADYYGPWLALLSDLAAEAGVAEPQRYAAEGAWKARRGGAIGKTGLPRAQTYDIATLPCQSDDCSVNYELTCDFDLGFLGVLLRPFGQVSADLRLEGVGQYYVVGPHGGFALRATPHWRRIRATFEDRATRRRLEATLRLQFRKLQACVGCGACAAICPQGAIVKVGTDYTISDGRCTHCLHCVRGLKAGCRAADSLHRNRAEIHV